MDLKKLAEKVGLEESEYLEMLTLFFESGGSDIERIETALREGNAAKAHEASHSLKGSAGSLGLEKIFELAKMIDDKDRQGILDGLAEPVTALRCEYELLVEFVKSVSAG